MSLLFEHSQSTEASFTLKTDSEYRGSDVVLVGKCLWTLLVSDEPSDRIALSISPQYPYRRSTGHTRPLSALTCWAVLDEGTSELAIPSKWLRAYGHIFSRSQNPTPVPLAVVVVQPVLLTEVIVTALSTDSYRAARSHDLLLESWLSKDSPILRQGAIHSFSADLLPTNGHNPTWKQFHYRLDMVEPVLQGYARSGETKFVVTLAEPGRDPCTQDLPESNAELDSGSDQDWFEIDENFLASSVLPISPTTSSSAYHDTPLRFPVGHSNELGVMDSHSDFLFRIIPLRGLTSPVGNDCTVYIRTSDLGRVGALNGDWAVACSPVKSKARLVRLLANDDLVPASGMLACCPLLLYNITLDCLPQTQPTIVLRSSPFGSRPPAIPIARTMTVARIASPFSIDRTYQPLFLRALKLHFDGTKHLFKKGDMIAIRIDTDAARRIQETDAVADDQANVDELDQSYPYSPERTNALVFFLVTGIEYDVLSSDADTSPQDIYIGSTVGELGCWVDTTVTRMLQTGVEHSRVPNISTYMGISSPIPPPSIIGDSSAMLGPRSAFRKILSLTSATLAPYAVDYGLDVSVLLKGARGTGKFTVSSWVAQRLGMHILEINCYELLGENIVKTEGMLRARFEKASSCSPCILVLRYVDAIAQTSQVLETGKEPVLATVLQECVRSLSQSWNLSGYPVVVFGTTSEPGRIPVGVQSCFKHEVEFDAPGESERYEVLSSLLMDYHLAPDVSLLNLATQTAALVASDLVDLVTRAKVASLDRVMRTTERMGVHLAQTNTALTAADFELALLKARSSYSEGIGAPRIPDVSWDDVGGLAHVKSDILDTIQLPLDHPELFADGLKKRSGILLYGPPGTGKTLVAKAVATSCNLNFFSVKGPELLNMYIGESEANVRRVFQRARDAKPCVIFFDELDSVAPKRGNHGDSGGVMDRIVSQLLAELDGMSAGRSGADIFVIGATNRPDLLDPALLRPGRFDRMLYLGVSETHHSQLSILQALTRKFRLDPTVDMGSIANRSPFNYTGADFYALCSDAILHAMSRKAEELEIKIATLNRLSGPSGHRHPLTPQYYLAELASADDVEVLVSQRDFDTALHDLIPSVSQSEMEHYRGIQRQFSRELLEKPLPEGSNISSYTGLSNGQAAPGAVISWMEKRALD